MMEDKNSLSLMQNKQFVFTCLKLLEQAAKLDDNTIAILTDPERCKELFYGVRAVPILKMIPEFATEEELKILCYDGSNKPRFYSQTFDIGNKTYIVTNYWYGPDTNMPDNRTPFMEWVLNQVKDQYK